MPTKISWTDESWNPVVGCTKCSIGCENCYAERMAKRLSGMELARPVKRRMELASPYHLVTNTKGWNGRIATLPNTLAKPLHWKKPRRIFVCSMGDLFHPAVPISYQDKIVDVANKCPQHTLIFLTKRASIMYDYSKYRDFKWPENIIGMVTAENQERADWCIPYLLQCGFKTTGVSLEPLLGEIDIRPFTYGWSTGRVLDAATTGSKIPLGAKLDWVIIGCESINGRAGRFSRNSIDFYSATMDIIRQCKAAGVPVFVKQIPRVGCRKCGFEPCTHLHGHRPKTFIVKDKRLFWPEELRVQEKPLDN